MTALHRLSSLLNMAHLQKMANSHYSATGMPIGIIDAFDGAVLVGSGWQEICLSFHRTHPKTLERCRESDAFIKTRLVQGEAYQYKCKNGLWDIGIPIVVGDEHLATLFLGQFFYENEMPDRDFFTRQAKTFGFNMEAYMAALDRVPVFSREKVAYILEYDKALAAFIEDLAEQAVAKMAADEKITNHLSFMQTLVDTIPSPIFYKDLKGRYLGANRAWCEKLIRLPIEKIINKTLYDLPDQIPKQLAEIYHTADMALIETGGTQVYEEKVKCADGSIRDFIFTKGLFPDASGSPAGLVGVMVDVTDQRRMEVEKENLQAQLLQLQKIEAIGALAGGIAHDFNNILSPIIGYTEMLLDEIPSESPQREPVEKIFGASIRARELVKQILVFSRQTEKEVQPIALPGIISEVLKLVRASLPATITIEQNIDNDCRKILADETHIHQIAMNIITNAYHAMEPAGGVLKIVLRNIDVTEIVGGMADVKGDHYVLLSISDTGTGMDERTLERVFDPYFTTKDKGRGTGLGLAVVHGIVKSCQGDIRIKSSPGKGTVVDLFFPALMDEIQPQPRPVPEPAPEGTEHLLLVDDEEIIVSVERQMLERLGYQVTVKTSSVEALEAVKTAPADFDLVISDMSMPQMTGIELLREIRKISPKIPGIICTGFSDRINDLTCQSLGVHRVIMKPVSKREIATAIRGVLDAGK